jgi:hypothetical protein
MVMPYLLRKALVYSQKGSMLAKGQERAEIRTQCHLREVSRNVLLWDFEDGSPEGSSGPRSVACIPPMQSRIQVRMEGPCTGHICSHINAKKFHGGKACANQESGIIVFGDLTADRGLFEDDHALKHKRIVMETKLQNQLL